jgi:hypothetical protein
MADNNIDRLSVVSKRTCAQIPLDEIEYIEKSSRKLLIVTGSRKYECRADIEDVVPYLAGKAFYRPMKSMIINFLRVKRMEDSEILFDSGRRYTMGKNNLCRTKMAYRRYLYRYPPFSSVDQKLPTEEDLILDSSAYVSEKKNTCTAKEKKHSSGNKDDGKGKRMAAAAVRESPVTDDGGKEDL